MRKLVSFMLVSIIICFTLVIHESSFAVENMPKISATFCNMLATDHPQSVAAAKVLVKEVAEKTNNNFRIDAQFNGALGSDSETVEATIMGTLTMTGPATATLATVDPNWYILDMPYVFLSKEHARRALDGKLGEYLSKSLEKKCGMICLGFGESGMRNISNNAKEIRSVSDLSGMKIRVIENKYHLATFKAFGSNPTAMAFSEVYTALQTRQIDGQDNPIAITYTSKFYEVQKYYSLTEHIFNSNAVCVNAKWFYSLPTSYQQVLRDAVKKMITEQRRLVDKNEGEYIQIMKNGNSNILILTSEQKQGFIDATKKVRDSFVSDFGDEGKIMLNLAKEYM